MPTRERSRVRTHLTLRVSFDLPLGATMQDAKKHVRDAIVSYSVLTPMHTLDPASVRVSYHSKEVTY